MIGVIGDAETISGFGLAGLSRLYVAKKRSDVLDALQNLRDAPVIIITRSLAELCRAEIERLDKVVVEIPERGVDESRGFAERVVRDVLGIKIELRG